jgi:pSer/pThr/pTyr-binding forkhead associated (FHA) protein
MGYRLRYMHHDLELNEGQFAVGRSSTCQLSLDDPLVSRLHAVFFIGDRHVAVEDQASRNGVLVNGQRIAARTQLRPGDRILIGSQELMLVAQNSHTVSTTDSPMGRGTLTRMPAVGDSAADIAGPPTIQPPSDVLDADASTVRRAHAFNLLGGVAEKALVMGRAEDAERLLATPLVELMEASRAGRRISPSLVDTISRFAAKLATATGKASWIDYVVELYQGQGRPCPAPVVDELNSALRRVTGVDLVRLRAYVALLHERQSGFGPTERFLVQRIEGLERLAALR